MIHPTALIAPRAEIGPDCEIGPFCVVGPDAVIGDDCRLIASVHVLGRTEIGARTANIDSLYDMIGEEVRHRTTAEWLQACERLDIPAAPMLRLDELPTVVDDYRQSGADNQRSRHGHDNSFVKMRMSAE